MDKENMDILLERLRSERLTGLLRVILNSCTGIVFFDDGAIVGAFEIFGGDLLVIDNGCANIKERCMTESGKSEVCPLQKEALHILCETLQEESIQKPGELLEIFLMLNRIE